MSEKSFTVTAMIWANQGNEDTGDDRLSLRCKTRANVTQTQRKGSSGEEWAVL